MNPIHNLELLRDDYTTVCIVFQSQGGGGTNYTYKILKADIEKYKVGTVVALPAAKQTQSTDHLGNLIEVPTVSVGIVVSVHAEPDIDFDAPFVYKWVIGPIDLTGYKAILQGEKDFNEKMLSIQKTKAREAVRAAFIEAYPEALTLLK